ncbi:hypothetical protein E3N88_23167 [Mikania micrantha]|uniref:Reverse transcriptase Ty1/copia-type domain-containing protein n=1 Tax=Mikania micrantha TaxID=192012 RepID=A0A5N6NCH8_9ASTR|nr:hypothetical protein E3N88_23167 [Mikania micrantha]
MDDPVEDSEEDPEKDPNEDPDEDPEEDPAFPDHVYKPHKALYGLHQAPRAWYATHTDHLLAKGSTRGAIDQTLFVLREKDDFILVQIYVDDIIFGSTSSVLCKEFEAVMKKKFEMSAMG